ncbi:GNAT family N-acetyltransferase [Nocardia sp. XZ_19_369]|uniref:GNAT family N-acetyltransferase n=1 Tax=Nocardia sp. XZ_19_369 TaxID=2769487 RepID=UPI0018900F25|nr:GNAT family protein [Nocardia sp. XZ_19_369]
MNIRGGWAEVRTGPVPNIAPLLHDSFRNGGRQLTAGSSIRPMTERRWRPVNGPSGFSGTVHRIGSDEAIGFFGMTPRGAGVYNVAVLLAHEKDWRAGLGADAMLALMKHMALNEGARRFILAAGIHNANTVRMLANGLVRPEALARTAIADRRSLRDLVIGSISAEELGFSPDRTSVRDSAAEAAWSSARRAVVDAIADRAMATEMRKGGER